MLIYKVNKRLIYFTILSLILHMLLIMSVNSGFSITKSKIYSINLIVVKSTPIDRENKFANRPVKKISMHNDTLSVEKEQHDKYTLKDATMLPVNEKTDKLNNKAGNVEQIKESTIAETGNNDGKDTPGIISEGVNSSGTTSQNATSIVNGKGASTYEGANSGGVSYGSYNATQSDFDKKKYLSFIVNYVKEHIPYPYLARKRGIEGDLRVSIVVDQNGKISSVKVIKSSGYQILDDNTIKYFTKLILPKKPEDTVSFEIKVSYGLRG